MKQIIDNYIFYPLLRKIVLTDFDSLNPIRLERIFLITNVTRNQIIYNFAVNKSNIRISNYNEINLTILNGGEEDTDQIQIIYDMPDTGGGGPSTDVTVVNATGISAVNIKDGGNVISVDDAGGSLTVDGSVGISGPVPVTDNGGSLTIDGTVAATQSGVWDVGTITNVVHVDDNASSLTVDGNVGISGVVHVDDNSGSLTVDGSVSVSNLPTVQEVQGNIASGSADSGFPVKIGGKYNAVLPTVTDGKRIDIQMDSHGQTITTIYDAAGNQRGANVNASNQLSVSVDNTPNIGTLSTISNVVHVDDNAGSLTIDNTNLDVALSTRLKPADTLAAVTTLGTITNVVHVDDNASTISIDDGGGSLTVDGTVAATQSGTWTVDSELTTADLDTGVGTDTRAVVGLAGAASGGAVLVQATSGGALKNDVTTIAGTAPTTAGKLDVKAADGDIFVRQATGTNLHAVIDSGTVSTITNVVHVDDNSSTLSVDDGAGSLTVDGTVAATQSGTWNVGTVTGITNVVHVDDNASTLSIDDGAGSITVDGTVTSNIGTTGGLALDATLTGGTQQTKITDGTQIANTLAGDSGQNSVLISGNRKEVSGSTTTAQAICSTDASNYRWVSIHITSQGTNSTVTFQCSNDNTNWVSFAVAASTNTTQIGQSTATGAGIWHGPLMARYFRLNVTGISAGTTAATVEFNAIASAVQSFGTVNTGNSAAGVADSGNPVKVGGKYNLTPPTLTDTWRGDLQIDAKGNLRSVLMDAAGNNRGANINASNQLSISVDNTPTISTITNVVHIDDNASTISVDDNGGSITVDTTFTAAEGDVILPTNLAIIGGWSGDSIEAIPLRPTRTGGYAVITSDLNARKELTQIRIILEEIRDLLKTNNAQL